MTRRPVLWGGLAVVGLTIVAHFLPFERAALAPDDYANLLVARARGFPGWVLAALTNPDRPVNLLAVYAQELLVNTDPTAGFMCLLLSSVALSLCVYGLFLTLIRDLTPALLATACLLLFPSTLELYHTLIYANIQMVFALYLLVFLAFVRFARTGRRGWLAGSVAAYTIAILWYEVGFFLPVVLAAYAWLYHPRSVRASAVFTLPAACYLVFRFSNAFGLHGVYGLTGGHTLNLPGVLHNVLVMIPNQFAGRHFVRVILYGLYKLPSMELAWLVAVLAADVAILWGFVRWLRAQPRPVIDGRLPLLGGVLFVAFLIPNALYTVEGRHTMLAALAIPLWALALLQWAPRLWRGLTVAVLLAGLLVSQGTAWIQVVASRINASMFAYVREHREELRRADRVVIDTASFTERIPYTWGERQTNRLNAYYGMQAFAPWGLTGMVHLLIDAQKPVYVGRTRPQLEGGELVFDVQVDGPFHRAQRIPAVGTAVINFASVYASGFRHGRGVNP